MKRRSHVDPGAHEATDFDRTGLRLVQAQNKSRHRELIRQRSVMGSKERLSKELRVEAERLDFEIRRSGTRIRTTAALLKGAM